jgi:LysM repeat protein
VTREHKISIIVGFLLVLVVAVFISDHWSRARGAGVEPVLIEEAALPSPDLSGLLDPLESRPPRPAVATMPPAPKSNPVVTRDDSLLSQGLRTAQRKTVPDKPWTLDSIRGVIHGQIDKTKTDAPKGSAKPRPTPILPSSGRSTLAQGSSRADGSRRSAGERDRWHPVGKGETLFEISKRYYGSGHLWPKLRDYNSSRVGRDGSVRQGVTLRIPPKHVLLGQPAPKSHQATKPPATKVARTYTVKKGDTLGEIAQRLMGSVKRMPDLIAANRGLISDQDDIVVGMVLKVPGR